ncbi:MAG: 16S rRNA (adenine(1518)-N(6)/adenine(1519)-N(6))-dimethyltransferase RsmA [Puniceicoccales bacterium]|jgi:16S rRNA (adenine1518-N6/adenine1519-N6)-dimethyltransferase|nr:16S rRNA (adenine(1518)-N(6)/adenine(1519)-N(6))-dimethyltransferase RsmA [Puniceicoccales bacterium]
MNTCVEKLRMLAHGPRRSLGQNFLIDRNILNRALDLAAPLVGANVVEIGSGLGILTEALLNAGANVYAVECDQTLYDDLLHQLPPKWPNSLHLLLGDAVKSPRAGFAGGTYKVVANLPYAISTPWLDGILRGPLPESMTLLLQREAAQRFMAAKGAKMGAISIRLSGAFQSVHDLPVAPSCFFPRPKVESALVHWARRKNPFIFSDRTHALIRFLFTHRRKQLRGSIRRMAPGADREILSKWLQSLADPTLRAEEITLSHWQYLEELFTSICESG